LTPPCKPTSLILMSPQGGVLVYDSLGISHDPHSLMLDSLGIPHGLHSLVLDSLGVPHGLYSLGDALEVPNLFELKVWYLCTCLVS